MTMRKSAILLAFALLFGFQQEAAAQFQIGPRIGYELNDVEELFIGAEARFAVASLPVLINPSFDYYLVDQSEFGGFDADFRFFTIKGNAIYEFGVDNQSFTPYAGAGLIVGFSSFDLNIDVPGVDTSETSTDFGLNLLGGARFQTGGLQPFVQAEIGLGDVDPFTIGGGLLFTFGGS